jgi:hypothetical protein
MLNLFCDKGWKLDNVTDYTLDGDSIGYWPLNEFDKSDIYYFYRDYSRAVDRTVRGKGWSKTEPNNWKFTQDCTHIAVDVYKHNYDERRIILNDSIYKKIIPNYAVDVNGVRTPINTIETYKL